MTTNPLEDLFPDGQDHNKKNSQSNSTHHRADVRQWRCMNCGQHIFTTIYDSPPDICEYCRDMTTWQVIEK